MTSRRRREGEPSQPWWVGASRFEIGAMVDGHPLVVAARCRLGSVRGVTRALLDTGAQWSVVGGDLADALLVDAEDQSREIILHSRVGKLNGRAYRLPVTLLAEEGEDLTIEASLVLCPSWSAPPVLGYGGFLERIRLGIDPGTTPTDDRWLFFGSDA